ncbi:hypothetical protein [Massilia alkalitolerans]|uniref:hypothetical protein n=1 Tax=Massilia alkalitolerans TaxID=286638 RepID=UPI000403EB90|nr:hypothetical protein [Massilia alkalitolerans]
MRNMRAMPAPSRAAINIAALTMLASFSACSHGSEPRMVPYGGVLKSPLTAIAAGANTAQLPVVVADTQAPVQLAMAVPAAAMHVASTTAPAPARIMLASAQVRPEAVAAPAPAPAQMVNAPDIAAAQPGAPAQIQAAVLMPVATQTQPPQATFVAPNLQQQGSSSWPAYFGAGVAGLSLIALVLLRRRDRVATQQRMAPESSSSREAERARDIEQEQAAERERDIEREVTARLDRQREAEAAAARAAADEIAAREEFDRTLTQASVAAANEQARSNLPPHIDEAHRLFDMLHQAERDVEPFLRLLDEAAPRDSTTLASRAIVAAWHNAMLSTRNRLSEVLVQHNAAVEMRVVEPAKDLQNALSRLIDHAARMSALMVNQKQEESAILHYSRQLPGALVQLFWRAQTSCYTSSLPQLPLVPDAPVPFLAASSPLDASPPVEEQHSARKPTYTPPPSAAAAAIPARAGVTRDKALQKAIRGGSNNAGSR